MNKLLKEKQELSTSKGTLEHYNMKKTMTDSLKDINTIVNIRL